MGRLVQANNPTVAQLTTLQPEGAEKHLRTNDTLNTEVDGLKLQKTTPGSTHVSQEWPQAHLNYTAEDWKNGTWFSTFQFHPTELLYHWKFLGFFFYQSV